MVNRIYEGGLKALSFIFYNTRENYDAENDGTLYILGDETVKEEEVVKALAKTK